MAAAICWGQQIKRISFISGDLFTPPAQCTFFQYTGVKFLPYEILALLNFFSFNRGLPISSGSSHFTGVRSASRFF